MTKLCRIIIAMTLAWAAGNALAQYASVPDEDLFRTDEQRYGHLQYFGFYASAMAHWNFTEDLAPFTNLTWIHVGSAADEAGAIDAMVERMRQARDAGVQAVLSLEPFLFENKRGDLRPDGAAEDFLVELRARLEYEDLLDTLLIFTGAPFAMLESVGAEAATAFGELAEGRELEKPSALWADDADSALSTDAGTAPPADLVETPVSQVRGRF